MDFSIQKCRKTAWKLLPATAVLMATGVTLSAYGATIAGTEIRNLATVSYEDSAGNSFTAQSNDCLLYTSPSPRDRTRSRMPSSA